MTPLDRFRSDLLQSLPEPLLCVDIGARWGADSALLRLKQNSKILCFDPDAEECERLQQEHDVSLIEYVPLALSSDGRDLPLYVTREPACSSIYEPLPAIVAKYPALSVMTAEKVVTVKSVSLDHYLSSRDLSRPNLFKLDTQGSELDILHGAAGSLSETCMIDIEVEFNPLYRGQALFSDVDIFLRSKGFSLWRLPLLVHYTHDRQPIADTAVQTITTPPGRFEVTNPGNGQLFWGQAHYVRSECLNTNDRAIGDAFARKAAIIASSYDYWDLALMALEKCEGTRQEAQELRSLMSA